MSLLNEDLSEAKSASKKYSDLACISASEITRCTMLIAKLEATINLLDAQREYYETLSAIEKDNESLGFDLSI